MDRQKKLLFVNIIVVIALAAGLAIFTFILTSPEQRMRVVTTASEFSARYEDIAYETREIAKEIKLIKEKISKLEEVPKNVKISMQVDKLQAQIDAVNNDIDKIRTLILSDPEKILSLILLENEVRVLKEAYDQDIQLLRSDLASIQGQNRWFIGLIFSIFIAVVGIAIANFRKG